VQYDQAAATVLLEALPYIREFYGRTVVIKYGGNAMIDEKLKKAFALNVVLLRYIGVNPVIVHGGGPQIGRMLDKLDIDCQFKGGLRVTDDATMNVVEMVLAGKVNKEIVNLINLNGGRAVGLSGKDGRLIHAEKLEMVVDKENAPPEIIDLGNVGSVTGIFPEAIECLQREGFIPVIAPVGVDDEGITYNINADTVAGALAAALHAKRLVLLTDVAGLKNKAGELVSSLSFSEASESIAAGTAQGGMIPKLESCLYALASEVEKAHIIDGRVENSLILELFTNKGVGTEITSNISSEY
jgi:acetylglutamate kinase